MIATEVQPGTKFWVKQKNALEYALARSDYEKEVQVSVLKVQKVRNFFALLFRVEDTEKVIFVEKNDYLL